MPGCVRPRALTAVRDQHEWQKQLRHLIADFNFNNSRDCVRRHHQPQQPGECAAGPGQESGPRHFFLSAPRSTCETAAARPGVWDPTANTSLVVGRRRSTDRPSRSR